jgi:HK97 family phage major capsid protein
MPEATRRLEWLRRQRETAAADVEQITTKAADEDRDLTDAEQSTCIARRSRLEDLDAEIEVEVSVVNRSAQYAELTSGIGGAPDRQQVEHVQRNAPADAPTYATPGEYLSDFCRRSEDPGARTRFEAYLRAAPAHQTTADNPGILPTPILEPVFIQQTQRRPAIEATTRRPLPGAGKTFTRPHITQNTLVGLQAAEKGELPTQTMKIDPLTVTKSTYGGVVNLSWQDRDWTDPSIMNLLVADMAGSYAQATDAAFCTYFAGSVTNTTEVGGQSTGGDYLGAIFSAAGEIFGATNALPDTIWCAPDVWGMLGSMVDTTGRPLFPTIAPGNSMGTIGPTSLSGSIAGIRLVVDKNFAAGTMIIGDSLYIETYETVGGQVSVIEPSVLGTQIAFYGYMAWMNLVPEAFIKLVDAVPPVPPTGVTATETNGGTPASGYTTAK